MEEDLYYSDEVDDAKSIFAKYQNNSENGSY